MSEHAAPSPKDEIFDSKPAAGIARLLGLSALGGLVILGICALVNLKQFAFSWLFAVVYFFMLCVGGLFWVLLHHAVDAEWSVVVRRQLENLAGLLKYLAVLFIPVLLLGPVLYASWWDVDPATNSLLATKSGYLNVPFFIIRTIVYFVVLVGLAFMVRKLSLKQDTDGNPAHTLRLRKIGTVGLILYAFSVAFAGFDWLMSLEYSWFSTMWGVYLFAGAAGSSMSLLVLIVTGLRVFGYFKHTITKEHYFIMGKWMLAFTIFWAYIGFSQYMLIWYANLPEETSYFLRRNVGSWHTLSLLLVIGRFFLPFPLLLLQATKKLPFLLSVIAAWILLMELLDVYLVVMPILRTTGYSFASFIPDVAAVVTVGSLLAFLFLRGLGGSNLFPTKDPALTGQSTFRTKMEATSIQNQNRHAVFPIFLWGFVLFCFFGFLAVVAVRWFGNFQSYDEQRAVERAKVLAEYRKTMDANLNTLKWADDQKQAAQIPIAEAMKITMKRLNARKVSASSVSIVPSTAVPAEIAPILSEGESALRTSTPQSGPDTSPKPEIVSGNTAADAAGVSAEAEIAVPTSSPAPTAEFLPDAPEAPR